MIRHTLGSSAKLLVLTVFVCALTACGGSSGTDDDLIVADSEPTDRGLQQDEVLSCDATLDIAEFLFTEIDRQWACGISTGAASSYSDLYFSRDGTALFSDGELWYWNRKLPSDAIGLASPSKVSKLITDIRSSNTEISFKTTSENGQSETYECVLVSREVNS